MKYRREGAKNRREESQGVHGILLDLPPKIDLAINATLNINERTIHKKQPSVGLGCRRV